MEVMEVTGVMELVVDMEDREMAHFSPRESNRENRVTLTNIWENLSFTSTLMGKQFVVCGHLTLLVRKLNCESLFTSQKTLHASCSMWEAPQMYAVADKY